MTLTSPQQTVAASASSMIGADVPARTDDTNGSAEAADVQLKTLQAQLHELNGKAYEIEEQARRLLAEGGEEAILHASEALLQAGFIRNTVAQITQEISAAPTTANGSKKLSQTRVAALANVVSHTQHVADHEKTSLISAIAEAVTSNDKTKKADKTEGKPAAAVTITATSCTRSIPKTPVHQPATSLAARAVENVKKSVAVIQEKARTAWENAKEAAHETMESIRHSSPVMAITAWGENAAESVSIFIGDPVGVTQKAAIHVVELADTHIAQPVKMLTRKAVYRAETGYAALIDRTSLAMEEGALAAERTKNAVVASYQEKKEWLASLLPGHEKPEIKLAKAATKPKAAPHEIGAMAKAMQQAAMLLPALPMSLNGQGVSDLLDISMPNLPKISSLFSHIPSLY